MELTAVLSGPVGSRLPLLLALQNAGLDISDQPEHNPTHGFDPDPAVGWITVGAPDLAALEAVAWNRSEWVLRLHWNTPTCPACSGHKVTNDGPCPLCKGAGVTNHRPLEPDSVDAVAELAELRARVAQLEGSSS